MSLFKRGNTWHFVLRWNGQRYRGSCKTSRRTEAKKVEALVLARLLEDGRLPWNRKVPILADFSNRFFTWLESLPADRPPKSPTRRYYQVGWQLLESTSIARMNLDHITADHALTIEGSSAANTNNALRTLRRMLKKAQEWQLLSTIPIVKLVEEQGREELIEPWMEQRLLTVAGGPRLTGKGRNSRTGWEPFRTVLLIMLDSGLRPGEIFRMRWESIHWDKGLIFNPRGKSRKSRRYVPLTERVKAALVARDEGVNEGWVFPSKRAQSGYITGREVSKQWLEAKRLAGIPQSVVLYCARHRFATDAMEGTGNVMAVMDAMGHQSVDTARIYNHSNVRQIREAIERRNQVSSRLVEAVQKLATKVATVA
ncbi:MAG TPA: tyrosine-type recombinase/integrase [Terriglobales bacterium]|nr:tyrosine-type recombinase/integrase [Terriglobales bacterium]